MYRCANCYEWLTYYDGVLVHYHDGLVACGGGPDMNILVGNGGAKKTTCVVLWDEELV